MKPLKIVQVTDLHLVPPGETLFDLDPSQRLRQCVEDLNRHHADADLVVITGDLAHRGEPAAYQHLRTVLADLAPPVQLLIGNHDDRNAFRREFPGCDTDENGFVQSVRATTAGTFVFLDTNEPGTHAGGFCTLREAWLRDRLGAEPGRPTYIFMHHHPFPVHYRPCDDIGLRRHDAFAAAIEGYDVRHIFFGHVHRPIAGSRRGVPFSALRGLNHQVWLDFGISQGIPCSLEPPAYAVVFIDDDHVVVHTHDFLDASQKYLYRPDAPVEEQVSAVKFGHAAKQMT